MIVDRAVKTNAGQTVKVSVTCRGYSSGRTMAVPRGDYELCTVRTFAKRGKVTLTTYGNPVKVLVKLKAPATEGYSAYTKKKRYYSR